MEPYTFEIVGAEANEVEEQTLTNEKTNEEFSIQKTPMRKIEVKRVAKRKDEKNEFKV